MDKIKCSNQGQINIFKARTNQHFHTHSKDKPTLSHSQQGQTNTFTLTARTNQHFHTHSKDKPTLSHSQQGQTNTFTLTARTNQNFHNPNLHSKDKPKFSQQRQPHIFSVRTNQGIMARGKQECRKEAANASSSKVQTNLCSTRPTFKGSQPEWCISSTIYSRDIPF